MLKKTSPLIAVLFLLLFFPRAVHAIGVTYEDSILLDEDGARLFFPFYVYSDRFMDEIYVISNGRIIIYTSDLFPLFTLGKGKGLESPQGVVVDAEGNLFVTQDPTEKIPSGRISVYDACLNWQKDIIPSGFEGDESFHPYHITMDKNGLLYVVGLYFPGVVVMDRDGHVKEVMKAREEGVDSNIADVAIDGDGRVYLLSEDLGRVFVYDEKRKFLFAFGEKGGSSTKLSRPRGIAVDDDRGRLYVVDYMRHTINVYDKGGTYLFEFGGMGWSEGWFQYPSGIAVDKSGRVIVADTFNQRVQVFRPEN